MYDISSHTSSNRNYNQINKNTTFLPHVQNILKLYVNDNTDNLYYTKNFTEKTL